MSQSSTVGENTPVRAAHRAQTIHTRFLKLSDLPALLELEKAKWDDDQAASAQEMAIRIEANPDLAIGAFCTSTGVALASLFLKPTPPDFWKRVDTWRACHDMPCRYPTKSLFGISLSSRSPAGVDAILKFFWPHALKHGWRHIYLGSPAPGLRDWLRRNPGADPQAYVASKRSSLPADPQLRYYHGRGFKKIMCVKPGYFPHERSLDYGVILRGSVPLSTLFPVWRALPLRVMHRITNRLIGLL